MSDRTRIVAATEMLTVALDLPSRRVLADQESPVSALQFVVRMLPMGSSAKSDQSPRKSGTRGCRRRCGRPAASYSRCFARASGLAWARRNHQLFPRGGRS